MDKERMQTIYVRQALLLGIVLLLLPACSVTVSGKFRAEDGVPQFIKVGQTTRAEVFDKLGEPQVHRLVAGKETAIYGSDRVETWVFYGTYEGRELVVRFENQVVSDVRIETTGSGWGCLMPPVYNIPGHYVP